MIMPKKYEDKYLRFLIFAVFYTHENYNSKCPGKCLKQVFM